MHFHREIKSWYSTILFISNSLKSDPLNCSIHHVLKHVDADSSYAIKQSLSKSKDLILITLGTIFTGNELHGMSCQILRIRSG